MNNREDKSKNNYFGHCVALPSEEEMYRWVSALLVAQVPHLLLLLFVFPFFLFIYFCWGGGGGCRGAGGIIQRIVFLASPHLLWLFFRLGGWGGGGWVAGQSICFQGWAVQGFFASFFPCFALVVAPKQRDITGMLWRGRVCCTS